MRAGVNPARRTGGLPAPAAPSPPVRHQGSSGTGGRSEPSGAGVTASVVVSITLPGGLDGAEAEDFTSAFLADLETAANAATGVAFLDNGDGTATLTFDDTFDATAGFSFSLATADVVDDESSHGA